ncbi:MAG: serine protease [Acidobacteria bacterium]|nr:MAG: serine protease [Acidobacteriota bacterium]PYQ19479.1 MAG: serine protease [Acidobacteriota bacterium]
MSDIASDLSDRLASVAASAGAAVVRVEGRRRAASSGVVFGADGAVVTAHHCLDWDEGIRVGLADGVTVPAALVGRDPSTDLALLRVQATGLATPSWTGPEEARVGQLVLGLSRPERGIRAGLGVVSATGEAWRTPAGSRVDRYIEADLALHAGFSGGLVVDASGRALGIETAGLVRGTAVVLPAPTVRRVAESLAAHGHVRRGFLGVGTMPVRLGAEQEKALGQPTALLVTSVQPDSAAARAGVLLGDALLAFDGHALHRPGDLFARLDEDAIGRRATLRVLRAGEVRDVAAQVGARDARTS